MATALGVDGKLHAAPELVIEVLSPGAVNERRDREAKLKLYGRRGVNEYWIVDWMSRHVEVHRREAGPLALVATLAPPDALTSPLLPGFVCPVADLFFARPAA
jgi:Uma2 family endonuclease